MKSIIKIFGSSLTLIALLCISQSATAQSTKTYTNAELDVFVQQQAERIGLIPKAEYDEANYGMTYEEYMRDMRGLVRLPKEMKQADVIEQKSATKEGTPDGQ